MYEDRHSRTMGICSSSESASAAPTAILIFENGKLEEFPHPIQARHVLRRNPMFFICNSDEMEFDDVVSAVEGDEALLPGHLYFALPLDRLNRRLKTEEIAALAVKASAALRKLGGLRRQRKAVEFCVEGGNGVQKSRKAVARGGDQGRRRRRRGKFTARLAAIPE